ncbi:YcaO-like family protein [Pseudomonas guariconensis]|uniref:YcaO-like family protein n=1 Tax=Pseudomonas TaxID=286 RepID=UPI0020986184|nr:MULTISPECIES: YcaO-like family protein [Pseudomonas]MCO7636972.1 YcaO-like family protein [Pseudomonas sp. S 311-6]MCO7516906.1 YcaO-like family protein [Pseudomonas putida]MCO7564886.1 YcaO-like family protein [Pseudomonas mosselii]MCO7594843.1 YcaO-like family protein [Pseudomonas guariconensis]MCO7607349.1 YcaO-like family protein [Pseudomonas guariconensis]
MNIYNEIHTPAATDFELHRPGAVSHLPHSVECGSRWGTYGSSSGWSSEVINCAIGEQFERKHFYLDVPVHDTSKLDNGLTPEECDEFSKAFSQTSTNGHKTPLHSHLFDRTNVFRITDFTPCRIPTVCISISPGRNPVDNKFYPMRDTCGCSAHVTIERAILGALKESLERQFLLRFWLTKTCTDKVSYLDACSTLKNLPSRPLLQQLHKNGELCILNLTDDKFPGSCILLCYGNKNDKHARVKYCAGMAYSDNLASALEKATIELWQTFRFMQSFSSTNNFKKEIEDPYLSYFMECNHYSTYNTISSNIDMSHPKSSSNDTVPLTCQNLISAIRKLKLNGYLYLSALPTKKSNIHFCKYTSPNLFLHMNNAFHLNTKNTYSDFFSKKIITTQLTRMVPFP